MKQICENLKTCYANNPLLFICIIFLLIVIALLILALAFKIVWDTVAKSKRKKEYFNFLKKRIEDFTFFKIGSEHKITNENHEEVLFNQELEKIYLARLNNLFED